MKTQASTLGALLSFGVLAAFCSSSTQAALSMKTVPSSVYQHMTTSQFWFGHTVIAGTYITRLTAGGSYSASCVSQDTQAVTGGRTLTSEVLGNYNQLYVTVPAVLPASREMPGFDNVPRGSRLDCYYNWSSFAKEATYTIGIPGSSITIGGGEAADSGVVKFVMQKPGTATGGDDACIP
jgi:hypothetical protein